MSNPADKCQRHDFKLTYTCGECWAERAINEQAELRAEIQRLTEELRTARGERDKLQLAIEISAKPIQYFVDLKAERDALQKQLAEVGRNTLPCGICELPVMFEFTVASEIWNRIVRRRGISEYLCAWCFNKLAEEDGESRVQIGVNFVGGVVHSGWCSDDVPGAYANEPTRKQLEAALKQYADPFNWTNVEVVEPDSLNYWICPDSAQGPDLAKAALGLGEK